LRILFLHEVGYLEKPIFEMHEFPEHLAARGHEVAFADYSETPSHQTAPRFGAVIQGRVLSGASLRLYSQKAVFPGIIGRLLAVFLFPFFFHRVLSDFKPNIVVSFAVPTSGWQAAIICRMHRRPLLFRALDVSHKIRRSMFASLVKVAERFVYSNASWVSCNNPALLGYCISLGAKEGKSSVDYPPLDLSHFLEGASKKIVRSKLGIPQESQVILYMGSFFYFSGLADVLRNLALMGERPTLVLIGGGEQDAELRAMTENLHLENSVKFTGFVEFGDLPAYLSIADVAINPMVPSLVSNKALPNKVLQYMASGLPVVTTKLDGLSSIFEEQGGIESVADSTMVLSAAVAMLENPELEKLGEVNRGAVARKFDVKHAVQSFEQRLLTLGLDS